MFCRQKAIAEQHRQAAGKLKRKIMKDKSNSYKKQKAANYPLNLGMAVCETDSPEIVSPELLETIERVAESLDERYQNFILLRYKDKMTYAEIGQRYNLSISRIRDVTVKAVRKIRSNREIRRLIHPEEAMDRSKLYITEARLIVDCNFNMRITNALLRAGIRTVDELRELDAYSIAKIRNLGKKSVDEIIKFLKSDKSDYTGDSRPIEDCDISMRLISCLRRAGIDTMDELKKTSLERLSHIRNISNKDIAELRKMVNKDAASPVSEGNYSENAS